MQTIERLGAVADVLAAASADARPLLLAVRELVASCDPDATETPSPRERVIWWGVGPNKMRDGYAYVVAHGKHVNLGFFEGASLPDPTGRLGGPGKKMRHLKITSPDQLQAPDIRALVQAAIAARHGGDK